MSPKSKEFLELQSKWYEKLEKSGFNDIEQDETYLKMSSSSDFIVRKLVDPIRREINEEYYRLAGHFLHEYKFKTKKERVMWELHAQGISIQDIVAIMKKRRFKVYKRIVHEAIQFLAAEMGKQCKSRT